MKGWGAKKFGMSLKTREIKLFRRDIPGFCWDIPAAPEKFEKKKVWAQFLAFLCNILFSGCNTHQVTVSHPSQGILVVTICDEGYKDFRSRGVCKRRHGLLLALLTCFRASFFPFCPLSWPPSSSPFLGIFSPFSPPRKVLCSVEQKAQRRAWRGAVLGWTSPQISRRKFLPEICVKKRSVLVGEYPLSREAGGTKGAES